LTDLLPQAYRRFSGPTGILLFLAPRSAVSIQLTTLGDFRAFQDDLEVEWVLRQRLRGALLVHVAVERRVSRESLLTLFWPDRDAERAAHALRQSFYHLNTQIGARWIEARGREVRVSSDVGTDVQSFLAALDRGDAEAAARVYRGPFLDGVHLTDLAPWEHWVDARRSRLRRQFRTACRDWLELRRGAGDLGGAIEAAQHWVARDPIDDEAHHRFIAVLAEAGERVEALRQYESYSRLLAPEGLRPLDETVELVERLGRASSIAAPPARPVRHTTLDSSLRHDRQEGPAIGPPTVRPTRKVPWRRGRAILLGVGLVAGSILVVRAVPTALDLVPGGSIPGGQVLESGQRIVLADFSAPASDPELGAVVTEALRIDLLNTPAVQVLEPTEVRVVLARMQLDLAGGPLDPRLAREVAMREGAKAVLEGDVARAGTGYVLTAVLRAADSGRSLAAFRETAQSQADLIPAIDRLSRSLRQGAGESLRSMRAAPRLAEVTTASLEALRVYTLAIQAFAEQDGRRGIALLEEALELDPEFASAWRRLAMAVASTDHVRTVEAATRAYELRYRLPEPERQMTVAAYRLLQADYEPAMTAYRRVLELDPTDHAALNNLGLLYRSLGDFETASELFLRVTGAPDAPDVAFLNLAYSRLAQGRYDLARVAMDALTDRHPENPSAAVVGFWIRLRQGDDEGARTLIEPLLADRSTRGQALEHLALLALWRGRISEARRHLVAAEQTHLDAGDNRRALDRRLRHAYVEVAVGSPERGVHLMRNGAAAGWLDTLAGIDRRHDLEAAVLGMAGLPDAAESVLRRFAAEVPSSLHDRFRARNEAARVLIHLGRGDPEAAIRIIAEVRASHPCRLCLAKRMGWALLDAGRLHDAAREWELVLDWKDELFAGVPSQVPQILWTLQRLPPLYEELGDTVRALHHYRQLVALWDDADPELQPRVDHARTRIAALEGWD
jgi:DNA-binding SARP family transcriptional activator/tetratricopeptide (TPR) repeat protein